MKVINLFVRGINATEKDSAVALWKTDNTKTRYILLGQKFCATPINQISGIDYLGASLMAAFQGMMSIPNPEELDLHIYLEDSIAEFLTKPSGSDALYFYDQIERFNAMLKGFNAYSIFPVPAMTIETIVVVEAPPTQSINGEEVLLNEMNDAFNDMGL